VESGGAATPREFAEALNTGLAAFSATVPRGRLTLEESAAIAAARQRWELRAMSGERVSLFNSDAATVLYDEDPSFQASCLNRTVYVKPVADLVQDVPRLVTPVRRYLQTCGVAADADRRRSLAEALGRVGLDRVCPLGRMGDVAPTWHHDGRFNLLELLHWTDLESDSSAGRWEFDHPDLGLYGRS
jgi:hypothetical protein